MDMVNLAYQVCGFPVPENKDKQSIKEFKETECKRCTKKTINGVGICTECMRKFHEVNHV